MLVGSALKSAMMLSVVAVPVAVVVITGAQAPEAISVVRRAEVPLAIVFVEADALQRSRKPSNVVATFVELSPGDCVVAVMPVW